jgi:hypothetical protein
MELTSACLYELLESEPRVTLPQAIGISDFAEPEHCKQSDDPVLRSWWAKLASGRKLPSRPPIICGCPGAAI